MSFASFGSEKSSKKAMSSIYMAGPMTYASHEEDLFGQMNRSSKSENHSTASKEHSGSESGSKRHKQRNGEAANRLSRQGQLLETEQDRVPLKAIRDKIPSIEVKKMPGKSHQHVLVPITDPKYGELNAVDQVLPPVVVKSIDHVSQPRSKQCQHPHSSDSQSEKSSDQCEETKSSSDCVTLASRTHPRRCAMQSLIQKLDAKLEESGARNDGFCPTRRQIYDDLFDEVLRQVTLDCPERGLLLWRVRQEAENSVNILKWSLGAAEDLGEERVQQIDSENKIMQQHIQDLESEIRDLQRSKRLLEQRQENVYEASKMQRDFVKKQVHEKDQAEMKTFNSQNGSFATVLQDCLTGKRQFSRLKNVFEDNLSTTRSVVAPRK